MHSSSGPDPCTPRLPSRHGRPSSSQSPVRPSSARSLRTRPATPGSPTLSCVGLNTDVKVDTRPVTQQGMMSMRSSFQGPGRQILDRSYYVGKLRSKKQELQQEIGKMVEEIQHFEQQSLSNVHVEQKQDNLSEEVKGLKMQLGDFTMIIEKVNAGVELEEMKEEFKALKEKNMKERKKVEKLFLEHTLKEREAKEILEKAKLIEFHMEHKIAVEAPEARTQYIELQQEYKALEAEVESLQSMIGETNLSSQALEHKILKSSPAKQKFVMLTEQLLSVEGEVEKLKTDCPSAKLTVEEAREALLSKIRQDNLEIIKAEETSKELEKEISGHEAKVADAERILSELKGGRMEKFLEMQQKEKKMQAFIDNFENIRGEHEKRAFQAQQRISQLLEQISQGLTAAEGYKESKRNHEMKFEDIERLKRELESRRGELKQLEDFEAKAEAEISSTKQNISLLEDELERFNRFDDIQSDSDANWAKLEAEKQKLQENHRFIQGQVKEQIEKIDTINNILSNSELHKSLEEMKKKLHLLQESNQKLQEEVERKARELNYKPVLENIRFMVAQLNSEIKNSQMQ